MVKKISAILLIIVLFSPIGLTAADFALTAGPISFFSTGSTSILPDGLYAQAGLRSIITPRIEVELGTVVRMTPDFAETLGISALIGYNLLAPYEPAYFNMVTEIGVLYLYETESAKHHPMIHLRITPLMIGNPYYVERGRLFTIGGLYDVSEKSFMISFSTIIENWFL